MASIIRMVVLDEDQFDPDEHSMNDGDPRGRWRKEDITAPNDAKGYVRVGILAEAVIEGDGFTRTIRTPGTWGVWIKEGVHDRDPYALEVFKEEKRALIEAFKPLLDSAKKRGGRR